MTSKLSFFVILVLNLLYYCIFLTARIGNSLCNVIFSCSTFASYITMIFKALTYQTWPHRESEDNEYFMSGGIS